jgi:hypothetical protein
MLARIMLHYLIGVPRIEQQGEAQLHDRVWGGSVERSCGSGLQEFFGSALTAGITEFNIGAFQ